MQSELERYTRVTDILKPYRDFSNIPEHILQHAADRGTRVHLYCELYASKMLFEEIDQDCEPYLQAFKRFLTKRSNKSSLVKSAFFAMIL